MQESSKSMANGLHLELWLNTANQQTDVRGLEDTVIKFSTLLLPQHCNYRHIFAFCSLISSLWFHSSPLKASYCSFTYIFSILVLCWSIWATGDFLASRTSHMLLHHHLGMWNINHSASVHRLEKICWPGGYFFYSRQRSKTTDGNNEIRIRNWQLGVWPSRKGFLVNKLRLNILELKCTLQVEDPQEFELEMLENTMTETSLFNGNLNDLRENCKFQWK